MDLLQTPTLPGPWGLRLRNGPTGRACRLPGWGVRPCESAAPRQHLRPLLTRLALSADSPGTPAPYGPEAPSALRGLGGWSHAYPRVDMEALRGCAWGSASADPHLPQGNPGPQPWTRPQGPRPHERGRADRVLSLRHTIAPLPAALQPRAPSSCALLGQHSSPEAAGHTSLP